MTSGDEDATDLDFDRIEALTFDCYGTLIDWERGIVEAVRGVIERTNVEPTEEELLEAFARHESELERGPYLRYGDILARTFRAMCQGLGITPTDQEVSAFARSVGEWPAFDDSPEALARLAGRFRLGVITNCDDDLFAESNARLGVDFDWVVTAEQVQSYKPDVRNFQVALARMGLPADRVLHVAQSLYHDHVPAKELGLSTVWVDRRRGKQGSGATPAASATPDLVVADMRSFAGIALGR
jgi:2-haloacid dehalogenase